MYMYGSQFRVASTAGWVLKNTDLSVKTCMPKEWCKHSRTMVPAWTGKTGNRLEKSGNYIQNTGKFREFYPKILEK